MTDIASIARGLSRAQTTLLRRMAPDVWHEAFYLRSAADVWAPGASLTRLAAKGLVDRRGHLDRAPTVYQLTPLGLRVRAFLRGEGNG